MEKEIFLNVKVEGFENYLVSNLGRISNGKKIMKDFYTSDGYKRICLSEDGKQRKFMVHRLVALTFIGKPEDDKMQVNHINFIRDDNRLSNLEWVTPKENINISIKAGNIDIEKLRKQSKRANDLARIARWKKIKITNQDGSFEIYKSAVEAEEKTGLPRRSLGAAARKELKTYRGLIVDFV